MKPYVECPHCGSRNFSERIYYYSGDRPAPHPGCLATLAISLIIGVILFGVWILLTAGAAEVGPSIFLLILPILPGMVLLLAAWAIAGNRKVRYACQTCGTIWVVPLPAMRAANFSGQAAGALPGQSLDDETPDEGSVYTETLPSPLLVNDLITTLQNRDIATRRIAAARLRMLLPTLDALPATKAGAEQALAEYERRQ